jgi:hypothetical protein
MAKKGEDGELKKPPQQKYQCLTCGNVFYGPKKEPTCPIDGEQERLVPLNEKGTPLPLVQQAFGASTGSLQNKTLRFKLGGLSDPTDITPEEMQQQAFMNQIKGVIREQQLENARAQAADARSTRLEAERKLKTREGEEDSVETPRAGGYADMSMFGPSMTLSTIMSMPEDQREVLLDRIAKNPQFAISLGMLLSPPQGSGNIPMTNQYLFSLLAQQGSTKTEREGSMKDVADMFRTFMETIKTYEGSKEEEIKDVRKRLDDIMTEYHNFRLDTIERFSKKEEEGRESLKPELLRQVIKDAVQSMTEEKGSGKRTTEILSEAVDFVRATENLKKEMGGGDRESFDEWLKKNEMQDRRDERRRLHEAKMAELEAKKEHMKAARQLLQTGMFEGLRRKIKAGTEEKVDNKKTPNNTFADTLVSFIEQPPAESTNNKMESESRKFKIKLGEAEEGEKRAK